MACNTIVQEDWHVYKIGQNRCDKTSAGVQNEQRGVIIINVMANWRDEDYLVRKKGRSKGMKAHERVLFKL
jgi:hypothetical protein